MATVESNALLLARLNQLVRQMPQAEIARKTGASRNNVSRYLRGTKMPLEFGVALVKGLGVNPAWLLAGEGSPWLSDVAAGTAKTAEDLLALVNAMAEVARMRLGSLAGKHHLKVLRELNDAMQHYETLRERLNNQTLPFFAELLRAYEQALLKGDVDRAGELRKALGQVSRLSDDAALARQFTRAQAYHEHFFGTPARAIDLQRKVLRIDLSTPGAVTELMCSESHNFALTLRGAGRLREARTICAAMRTLAEHAGLGVSVAGLAYFEGSVEISLGELGSGLPKMTSAYPNLEPLNRARSISGWLRGMLCTQTFSLDQAFDMRPDLDHAAPTLLSFAVWLEDPALLAKACSECIGDSRRVPATSLDGLHSRALLAALRKQQTGVDAALARAQQEPAEDARARFLALAPAAQLARAADRTREAARLWRQAQDALAQLQPGIDIEIWHLATHWREALRLNFEKDRAAEFFTGLAQRGYNCYAALAEPQGIRKA